MGEKEANPESVKATRQKNRYMKEQREPRVWIVEMNLGDKWFPTVGIGLNRDDGRVRLREWQGRNPSDKFRLRPYALMPRATGF